MFLLLVSGSVCRADILTFRYASPTADLAGTLTGTLEPDGNRFDVSGLQSVSWHGTPVAFTPAYIYSRA